MKLLKCLYFMKRKNFHFSLSTPLTNVSFLQEYKDREKEMWGWESGVFSLNFIS